MTPVTLSTARLTLSPLTEADIDAVFEACQDAEVQRWTPVPVPYTREDAATFVALTAEWWQTDGEYTWSIRHDDEFCGVIGIMPDNDGIRELGFWLAKPVRGRGVLHEAANAVIDFAFHELKLVRISCAAYVGNTASLAAQQRLGFTFEGTRRLACVQRGTNLDGWFTSLLATDSRESKPFPPLDT